MSIHIHFFVILSIITLISTDVIYKNDKKSILNENIFSLEVRCAIPMLANSFAEFQIYKNKHVLIAIDIHINLVQNGLDDNDITNPEKVKYVFIVLKNGLAGDWWVNKSDNVITDVPPPKIAEISLGCANWIRDIEKVSNYFTSADSFKPLDPQEAKIADEKFRYTDEVEKTDYDYLFKKDNLTALVEFRRGTDILENLISFVLKSRVLQEEQLTKIPDNVIWDGLY